MKRLTKHSNACAAWEWRWSVECRITGRWRVEALAALGHGAQAVDWADRYRRELLAMPEAVSPLTGETWQAALGAIDRTCDWVTYFRAQLAEASWQSVFNEWIGCLLPGAVTAGTHGLIRTAHALRALDDGETQLRIEELGVALAYWAAFYRERRWDRHRPMSDAAGGGRKPRAAQSRRSPEPRVGLKPGQSSQCVRRRS